MKLEEVSQKNIQAYYETHYDNGTNNYNRNSNIIKQLIKDYPSNTLIQHVLPKAILINQLYSTNIFAIDKIAEHITTLNISKRIAAGDDKVIGEIATGHGIKSKKRNTEFEFYSFATKYAWCHNPSDFIIYDNNVDCVLWEYKKETAFCVYGRKDLKEYSTFKKVFKCFREYYDLENIDSNLLDKFLWRQGDLLLTEKRIEKELRKKDAAK